MVHATRINIYVSQIKIHISLNETELEHT